MIYESEYWKDDLLKKAKSLRSRKVQQRWPESSFARVEQCLMLGFYSIRKLIDAKKLSDSTTKQLLSLSAYPWAGKPVTKLNWHHFDELYKLDEPEPIQKDVLFLCHQFVHSYVFILSFDESGTFDGIFFTSDRYRNERLHLIRIDDVISLFETVGNDYPASCRFTFNPKTLDYDYEDFEPEVAPVSSPHDTTTP